MGLFDSISSATTSVVDSVSNVFENGGPAAGLSGITDSISGAVKSVGSFIGGLAGATAALKLPLPNVLSDYASYEYILSLSVLSTNDVNFPDSSYKAGKPQQYICKTGGIAPNNRIQTQYGKFDFFMDNLNMESVIGLTDPRATNVTTVQFDVFEPYSMGVFMLALQQAAYSAGHENWRDAPFLITVEFRGNKENGQMLNIPNAVRHIPVKLTTVMIKASEQGTTYNINAYATSGQALTTQFASLRTDTAIKGKSVQEVLQTGEQSLQAVVNKKLKSYVTDGTVAVADEIIILFPTDISSGGSLAGSLAAISGSATISPNSSSAGNIYTKLGVSQSKVNQTSVQSEGDCNALGKASMGYDLSKKADQSTSKENAVYDKASGIWTRGNVQTNPKEGTLRFTQGTDIPTVINQIMLLSEYPNTALEATATGKTDGFKPWWRVDTQVFYVDSKANLAKTGTLPRVIVYRVVPYDTHNSRLPAANTKQSFEPVTKQVTKQYDYLYTGKNSEVIKFDIDFSVNFANVLAADGGNKTQDKKTKKQTGDKTEETTNVIMGQDGKNPEPTPGAHTSQVKSSGLLGWLDRVGGGGQESAKTRAAKVWHQAVTNPNDMIVLNMEIVGDPFWIVQSGIGNYTAKPVQGVKDLTSDGTVNWQNGEVDILVNFRSPLDINQATGLYDFKSGGYNGGIGTGSKTSTVVGWSGLYYVNRVTSIFRNGAFRQTLKGARRPNQEHKVTDGASKALNISKTVPEPAPNAPATPTLSPTEEANANMSGDTTTGTENPPGV